MIHTFQISYALSLSDANLCAYRLNERTRKYEGYKITKFLDISKNRGSLIFTLPELIGIKSIELLKYKDRDTRINFRIYFIIEAQLLLTGTDTLDLYFSSPANAKELQMQYAKAIYSLFPEAFNGRPASSLYNSGYADVTSYTDDEFEKAGLYSLPYLPLASVTRMDFTFDAVSEDEEHARLFTEMLQKTYYDGRKKIEIKGFHRNLATDKYCYDKVNENASRSFSVYYKFDKMCAEEYDRRPNIEEIRDEARNITRIEMSKFKPNRDTLKSMTTLQVPSNAISLGPLPYIANEQVPTNVFLTEYIDKVGNGPGIKWYDRSKLKSRLNELQKQHKIKAIEKDTLIKISQAISQEQSLKKVINAFKKEGEITLHRKRDKNNKQVKEVFKCSIGRYKKYRDIAIQNGIMLVTIPGSRTIKELSAIPRLRNFDFSEVSSQAITKMLPYQSGSIPELPELYDDIISFLYGLYDNYNSKWNKRIEALSIPEEEEI